MCIRDSGYLEEKLKKNQDYLLLVLGGPNKYYDYKDQNLMNIFDKNQLYIGIAPGAGEKNKIWPIENYIKIANFFEKKSYKIVFFLGPQEKFIKEKLRNIFPKAIFPEEKIEDFSGPEVVMATTKFLSCALTNDSGVSHMLSTNFCPIIKLFGPKDSDKFTPISDSIHTISAKEFGSNNISAISIKHVIEKMEDVLFLSRNNLKF